MRRRLRARRRACAACCAGMHGVGRAWRAVPGVAACCVRRRGVLHRRPSVLCRHRGTRLRRRRPAGAACPADSSRAVGSTPPPASAEPRPRDPHAAARCRRRRGHRHRSRRAASQARGPGGRRRARPPTPPRARAARTHTRHAPDFMTSCSFELMLSDAFLDFFWTILAGCLGTARGGGGGTGGGGTWLALPRPLLGSLAQGGLAPRGAGVVSHRRSGRATNRLRVAAVRAGHAAEPLSFSEENNLCGQKPKK